MLSELSRIIQDRKINMGFSVGLILIAIQAHAYIFPKTNKLIFLKFSITLPITIS